MRVYRDFRKHKRRRLNALMASQMSQEARAFIPVGIKLVHAIKSLHRDVFRSQTVSREEVSIALFRCLGVFEVSTRPNSISVTVPPREAGKFSGFQGRQCRFP